MGMPTEGINEFKKLWNTSMLKMPFYRNTYYSLEINNRRLRGQKI